MCYGQNGPSNNFVCGPGPSGQSTEWSDHVRNPQGPVPYPGPPTYSYAPIFDDILACKLPAVSWVIPDGSYSDHPTTENPSATSLAIGPSWVGDIIDVVGQSYSLTHNQCDYWGYGTGSTNPEPTAIFVVWDDWGGWYDHVKPWIARQENHQTGYTECNPASQWGCGYTDGFRVPLLVVSPYTPNYVSGACGAGTPNSCPYFGPPSYPLQYVHDFGSILGFTEWNFGMQFIEDYDNWEYADRNAPDWQNNYSIPPLSDFFPLSPKQGQGRQFTKINTPNDYRCFQNHIKGPTCVLDSSWVPTDPDSY